MPSWLKADDPWLADGMRKVTEIARAEQAILRPTARAMDIFLRQAFASITGQPTASLQAAVSHPSLMVENTARLGGLTLTHDGVSVTLVAASPVPMLDLSLWPSVGVWEALVEELIIPAVAAVFDAAARSVSAVAELSTASWRLAYLGGVRDRLREWPTETFNYVRGFVAESIAEGTGIDALTKQLHEMLSVTGTVNGTPVWEWKARRIARTESIGAYNGGAYYQAVALAEDPTSDAQFKSWFATHDTRTRTSHMVAHGQVAALSEQFDVGGSSLLFPGDPLGPAGEVIQCRCTLLYLDADEAAEARARYSADTTMEEN